jgi:cob(I)alamin adenosyltransferase
MSSESERAARHRGQMARKRAVVDAKIAAATSERGVVVVNTGNGKGKSTAGFGMVARALGHGMRIGVVQFIKGSSSTGEETFFRRFPEVSYHVMGEGFTWETQDQARDQAAAEAAWEVACGMLRNPDIALVLLDELNIALKLGYVEADEVLAALRERPLAQHVVITGRGAPDTLIEFADTVTDMHCVKHAFQSGMRAQQGVEL